MWKKACIKNKIQSTGNKQCLRMVKKMRYGLSRLFNRFLALFYSYTVIDQINALCTNVFENKIPSYENSVDPDQLASNEAI